MIDDDDNGFGEYWNNTRPAPIRKPRQAVVDYLEKRAAKKAEREAISASHQPFQSQEEPARDLSVGRAELVKIKQMLKMR